MTTIDRASPVPIYYQLETLIREQIESGLWRPGERIPTENEFCEQHAISRAPVRQALSDLASEGVLVRRPGLGTFVNHVTLAPVFTGAPVQTMIMELSHWSQVWEQISRAWNADPSRQPVAFKSEVVSPNAFYDRLTSAVGSGTAPDVAVVDSVWVAGLARSGFLYALEDLTAQDNHYSFTQDLYPAMVGANSFNGKLYALPCTVDASLLWYRKDWFVQEGLIPPRDWNDLVEVARHFLQPHVRERYGLTFPLGFPAGLSGGEATVYTLLPFVWSAGADVCDCGRVVLDHPGTRRALAFLRDLRSVDGLVDPEAISYGPDTVPQLFARGKLAMALGGSYEAANLREWSGWRGSEFSERVGSVVTPAAPGATPVATLGGVSYVVLRQSQRPTLMMQLLQVASDARVVGNAYRSVLLASASPSFNSAISGGRELPLDAVEQMIAFGRARPAIPDYVKISRQLQAMFQAALFTSTAVEDIVHRTAEFISVISECPCVVH